MIRTNVCNIIKRKLRSNCSRNAVRIILRHSATAEFLDDEIVVSEFDEPTKPLKKSAAPEMDLSFLSEVRSIGRGPPDPSRLKQFSNQELKTQIKESSFSVDEILQFVGSNSHHFRPNHIAKAFVSISNNVEGKEVGFRRKVIRDVRFQQLLELGLGLVDQMSATRIALVLEALSVIRIHASIGCNDIWKAYLTRFSNEVLHETTPQMMRRVIHATISGDPAFNYFPLLKPILDRLHLQMAQCELIDLIAVTSAISANPEAKRFFREHPWIKDENTSVLAYLANEEIVDYFKADERALTSMLAALAQAYPSFSNVAWKNEKMRVAMQKFVALTATQFPADPSVEAMCQFIHTCGLLGIRQTDTFHKFAARMKAIRHSFSAEEVSWLLDGCYRLNFVDQDLLDKVMHRFSFLAFRDEISPKSLFQSSYAALALGQFENADEQILHDILKLVNVKAKSHASDLDDEDITNVHLSSCYISKQTRFQKFPQMDVSLQRAIRRRHIDTSNLKPRHSEGAVIASLNRLQLLCRPKFRTIDGIQLLLVLAAPDKWIALDCNIPSDYFSESEALNGISQRRHSIIKSLGFDCVTIPWWETQESKRGEKADSLDELLPKLLREALAKGLGGVPTHEKARLDADERLQVESTIEEVSAPFVYELDSPLKRILAQLEDNSDSDEE